MNFSLYIARRYLLSKKSKNVVNIISAIAMLGVIVGTTALVVVLSIFNGFDLLVKSFFGVFDSEVKITIVEGKQFDPRTPEFDAIRNDPSVAYFCEAAEEIAHFRFEDRQVIARIKGVNDDFLEMSRLDNYMFDGDLYLNDGNHNYTVIGQGLAYNLGAATNFIRPINISVPKKSNKTTILTNPFNHERVFLSGIYAVGQQEVDDMYALVSLDVARDLLEMDSTVTSVELALVEGTDVKVFQKKIQDLLGGEYLVQNRYQQQESYYKVAKSEKFFVFLILSFIVAIASFNLASSITMLILDKKKDIHILSSLGMTRKRIGRIFLFEGVLVSLIGALVGLVIGILLCLGQQHYGWLKFPGNFSIQYYPVEIQTGNLVLIFFTVLVIGIGASWLPLRLLPKKFFQISQD